MPGTQTKGFDAVMEFTEEAVNGLLHTFFDSGGLISQLTTLLGLGSLDGAFSLSVRLDRPTDVPLPANATDVVDMIFDIGRNGALGRLRAVVGISVDHSNTSLDWPKLDFKNKLHAVRVLAGNFPLPFVDQIFSNWLKGIGSAPLLPVPVNRGNTDPVGLPTSAGLTVVDDVGNRNAMAYTLTFAGGAAGNAAALKNFIPTGPGKNGTLAVSFAYLARILVPRMAGALGTDVASFDVTNDAIRLNKEITVGSGGDSATMDKFELVLRDGFIDLEGHVKKSGFCYSANGTVKGRFEIGIQNGNLVFKSKIEDPQVSVDVPWYCYLAGAIVGVVTGGLIGLLVGAIVGGAAAGGIIGAIVFGILVPVLMAIAENVLNTVIRAVTENLANTLSTNLSLPAVGLNLILQDAFIDDVGIHVRATPSERVPIRASGLLRVPNGGFVDLDNGRVGTKDMGGMDLEWGGVQRSRFLKTRCGAELARMGGVAFNNVLRWQLYNQDYQPGRVNQDELAWRNPLADFPFVHLSDHDKYLEFYQIFAIKTAEARHALIEVVEVFDDAILLQYRCYEKNLPHLSLEGGFLCEPPPYVVAGEIKAATTFVATPALTAKMVAGTELLNSTTQQPTAAQFAKEIAFTRTGLGEYFTEVMVKTEKHATFQAIANGFTGAIKYNWSIAGQHLAHTKGSVNIRGAVVKYEHHKSELKVTVSGKEFNEFLIEVTATDGTDSITAAKCATYEPQCKHRVPVIVEVAEYLKDYNQVFGVVRLANAPREIVQAQG